MTPEEKAKAYDKALERAKKWYNEEEPDSYTCIVESIFPELQKDEDEEPQENKNKRIRKALISILKSDFEKDTTIFDISVGEIIAWLENQGEQNYEFHGIAEPRPAKGTLKKLVDEIGSPKFKVKYANSEYNVLEIKEIAGVTYFGIEDEPNHIDYVLPDNCEIVSGYGYGVKEKGSPYPTKSAIFSEQKPVWSEEDDEQVNIITNIVQAHCGKLIDCRASLKWLESLKQRMQ